MRESEAKLYGRKMCRAYAYMYEVGCTRSELARIAREVEATQLEALSVAVQGALDIKRTTPFVNVVFFSKSTNPEQTPEFVRRRILRILPSRGAWFRELRAVFIFLADDILLRRVVIHELTHALLDILADGFAFPRAIEEGTAMQMERHLTVDNDDQWPVAKMSSGESAKRFLRKSDCMSIRELLGFDPRKRSVERDGDAYHQMAGCGWFLVAYLAWLRPRREPAYGPLLAELRRRNVTEPDEVRQLMARMYRMEVEEMEEGFRRFCTTGEPPR